MVIMSVMQIGWYSTLECSINIEAVDVQSVWLVDTSRCHVYV